MRNPPGTVEALRRPAPALLLRTCLVVGSLLVGGAFALGAPAGVVRDDIVAGILLAAIGGSILTRTGRGASVSPVLTVAGVLVSLWLVLFTVQVGFGSPLGRLSLALGVFSTFAYGFVHRVNVRARRQ